MIFQKQADDIQTIREVAETFEGINSGELPQSDVWDQWLLMQVVHDAHGVITHLISEIQRLESRNEE